MEPFDESIEFSRQREYLAQWKPVGNYLVDWVIAIVYDIMNKPSPFDYATRVGIGRDLLNNLNPDYPVASQRTLIRIVRNLFPYDRVGEDIPESIKELLEGTSGEGSELRKPDFYPLQDAVIKEASLVQERYNVLGESFTLFAIGEIGEIRYHVTEERVDPQMNIEEETMDAIRPTILKMVDARSTLYEEFPEEELSSVSNKTIEMRVNMKPRKDLPAGAEPTMLRHTVEKAEELIRTKISSLILKAKEVESHLQDVRAAHLQKLSDVLTMAATIHQYVESERFQEIEIKARELRTHINETYNVKYYLPEDICEDLAHGRRYYRDGWV